MYSMYICQNLRGTTALVQVRQTDTASHHTQHANSVHSPVVILHMSESSCTEYKLHGKVATLEGQQL